MTLKIAAMSITEGVWVFQSSLVTGQWMWSWTRQASAKSAAVVTKLALSKSLDLWHRRPWLHLLSRGTGSSCQEHEHSSTKQRTARATLLYTSSQHYGSVVCPRNTEMCLLLRMRLRKIMVTKPEPFHPSWDHSPTYQYRIRTGSYTFLRISES